jgi:hypothetical protein
MDTNAAKLKRWRKGARDRKGAERARLREIGCPTIERIDAAVCEATAYMIAVEGASARLADANADPKAIRGQIRISLSDLKRVVTDILVDREGFNRVQVRAALKSRLAPRKDHFNPKHVPSLNSPSRPVSTLWAA